MSVREYIGARYIPLFADPIEWDDTLTYEPLTVVKYQGASYVSRQSVPEGVPLSNTDYWILWADYNAQIEQYRQEVLTFDGRIDAIEDALPIADFDSVNTIDARFDAIEDVLPIADFDSVNTIDARFDAIEAKVASIAHRNFILFSDSFGSGIYTDSGVVKNDGNGWRKVLKSILQNKGCTVYESPNVSVGNAGFTSSDRYDVEIEALANSLTQAKKAEITDIIVLAGSNDKDSTTQNIREAVRSFISVCDDNFPNAHVKIGYLASRIYNNVQRGYALACGDLAVEYINGLQYLFLRPDWICEDGTHPTTTGYDASVSAIIRGIFSEPSYNYTWESNIEVPTGFSQATPSNPLKVQWDVSSKGINVTLGNAVPFSLSGWEFTDQTLFTSGSAVVANITNPLRYIPSIPKTYGITCQFNAFDYYSYMGGCYIADDGKVYINRRSLGSQSVWASPTLFIIPNTQFITADVNV